MAPSLCENCHKRPKYGTHRFCGKTCAAQAATKPARSKQSQAQGHLTPKNVGRQRAPAPPKTVQLCSHCGQKPKFNGFDYCGKSCAAFASASTQAKPPAAQGVPTTKQKTARSSNAPPSSAPVSSPPAKPRKAPQSRPYMPQDESTEEEDVPEEEEEGSVSTDLDAYPSESESEDELSASGVVAPQTAAKNMSRGVKPGGGVSKAIPGTCTIPGCGQPSHVDRHGVKTRYCSTKHREEAVKLKLEAGCIMCQRYPQSSSDYFCSSACRNQSMTKT